MKSHKITFWVVKERYFRNPTLIVRVGDKGTLSWERIDEWMVWITPQPASYYEFDEIVEDIGLRNFHYEI